MRLLRSIVALLALTGAACLDYPLNAKKVLTFATNATLRATSADEGNIAYALDTNTSYLRSGSTWLPLDPQSMEVFETFGEGASKGLATLRFDGAAFSGATGVLHHAYLGGGNVLGYASLGAGQTLDLAMTATGLDISGDEVDNEGYEVIVGLAGTSGRPAIIGTDPAFKFCVTATIATPNGTDDFQIGLRRPDVVNADFDNYLDAAAFSINTAATPAALKLETILNNAATTTTDTTQTWNGTTAKKFCLFVAGAGAVTYTNDGAAPTTTAAFTFDDGDPVVGFVRTLQATAAQTGAVTLTELELAYQ